MQFQDHDQDCIRVCIPRSAKEALIQEIGDNVLILEADKRASWGVEGGTW